MRYLRFVPVVQLALFAACTPAPAPQTAAPPAQLTLARGRITVINAGNAPEVLPVPPERTVKGAPFEPITEHGVSAGAIAHTHTYTTDDGLPMDDLSCSYKDANGMLWFGTNGGGITRYDGRAFTNFSTADGLPDNTILSLGGDRQGNIWIGTSTGGLCRYDGHRFTTFNIGEGTGLSKGITCMLEDPKGMLWFGSRGHGVFRYDGKSFAVLPVIDPKGTDALTALAATPDGTVWATTREGLARYTGDRFERIVPANGDSLRDVRSMVSDAEGNLWLGRVGGGITRYTHDAYRTLITHFPLLPGDPVRVYQVVNDGARGFWIASSTHGAIHFTPQDLAAPDVQQYSSAQGMPSNEMLSVVLDQHGDVWTSSRGAGITHLRGAAFSTFRGFKPISIAEDPAGNVWVGTADGLARFNGSGFAQQHFGHSYQNWNYSVSVDPQGRVGFGKNMIDPSLHGFSWYDGTDYHVIGVQDGRRFQDIFWTMHDRHGDLWAAGRRGAEHYHNGQRTSFTTQQGLGSDLVLSLVEDEHGAIWAGTDGGGFSCVTATEVTTWTTTEGLPNNVVWNVVPDGHGVYWVSTLAGLCRFDGRSFLTLTAQHGLPDNNVNQVMLTRDGRSLFVGTLNGLAVINGWHDAQGRTVAFNALAGLPNDSLLHLTPAIDVYNAATGFPVKDVQTAEHCVFEDSKGVVWIATGSDKTGLVRFDRNALRTDTVPLEVRLLNVSPGEERLCWYDLQADADSITTAQQETRVFGRALSEEERKAQRERYAGVHFAGIAPHFPVPQDLELDHRNNRITFTYVAVETARPEGVEYQHMLEGYDEHWSPPTHANSATYGNIHEGCYTFRVKAKNAAGVWSAPLEYRFTVLPPWYRTWWAYALYVLGAGGIVLLYIRIRLSALRRQKERLERTVDQRTEELRHQKEEADHQRERAEHSEKAKEQFLANVSHEIRTPMNAIMGMSDILRNRPHAPEQAKYLNAIAQSSENLLVIINDILDLSKIDAGRIEFESVPFAPREVIGNVKDVLHLKAEEKGLALTLNVDADVPARLIGDPTRLNQVVMNLAGNAIKFTERGSVTIHLHARNDPAGRPAHCMLVIDVMDTGIGIPEDRLEKIFEEFTQAYSDTTRKYGGTGLGLTISKRLTELQGGSIHVKSERDKGSTFTVRVPYALPSSIDPSPPA